MNKFISLFIPLFFLTNLYTATPLTVKDKDQQYINEDIYYKLNLLSLDIASELTKSKKKDIIWAKDVFTEPFNNLQSQNAQDTFYELDDEKVSRKGTHPLKYRTLENGNWFLENSCLMVSSSNLMTPLYSVDITSGHTNGYFRSKVSDTVYMDYNNSGNLTINRGIFNVNGGGNSVVYDWGGGGSLTLTAGDPDYNPAYFSIQGSKIDSKGSTGFRFYGDIKAAGSATTIGGLLTGGGWASIEGNRVLTNKLALQGFYVGDTDTAYVGNIIIPINKNSSPAHGGILIQAGRKLIRPQDDAYAIISTSLCAITNPWGNIKISSDTIATGGIVLSTDTYIVGYTSSTGGFYGNGAGLYGVTGAVDNDCRLSTGSLQLFLSTPTWVAYDSTMLGAHTSDYYQIAFDTTSLIASGDNLGNHIATTTVNMDDNDLINGGTLYANIGDFNEIRVSTIIGKSPVSFGNNSIVNITSVSINGISGVAGNHKYLINFSSNPESKTNNYIGSDWSENEYWYLWRNSNGGLVLTQKDTASSGIGINSYSAITFVWGNDGERTMQFGASPALVTTNTSLQLNSGAGLKVTGTSDIQGGITNTVADNIPFNNKSITQAGNYIPYTNDTYSIGLSTMMMSNVYTSTATINTIIQLNAISYVPVNASTGTIYMDTNYDINVCTSVTGSTRYWRKLLYE